MSHYKKLQHWKKQSLLNSDNTAPFSPYEKRFRRKLGNGFRHSNLLQFMLISQFFSQNICSERRNWDSLEIIRSELYMLL